MAKYQVVEKSVGADWQQVRYQAYAIGRFDTEEEAVGAARKYLTYVNCENALAGDDAMRSTEFFMMMKNAEEKEECFMGVRDGKDWYFTHPKDIVKKGSTLYLKGEIVSDRNYFGLEGKTEVAVQPVRGT